MKIIFFGAEHEDDVVAEITERTADQVVIQFPKLGRTVWSIPSYEAAMRERLCMECGG